MNEIKKIFCNSCKRTTRHELIDKTNNKFEDENYFIEELTNNIYKCCGCETYCIEEVYTNSCYFKGNEQLYDISYTPKRNTNFIEKKGVFSTADTDVKNIYNEIIETYNNENYFLCCIGIRSCIELILKSKDKKHAKLDTLIKNANYLDAKLREGLDSCRYLGNKVTHTMLSMNSIETKYMIDLLEQVMMQVYVSGNIVDKINSIATKHGKKVNN